jgi:superfamily II DNA/RNA helicase
VHADPPAEHKAYLHRSGRTARAGAAGTVVTLMTDQQVKDVRDLTRAAKISPTMTKFSGPSHPVLAQLAPGERVLVAGGLKDDRPERPQNGGGGGGGGGRRGGRGRGPSGGGGGQKNQSRSGQQGRSRGRGSSSSAAPKAGGHSAASFSGARRGR